MSKKILLGFVLFAVIFCLVAFRSRMRGFVLANHGEQKDSLVKNDNQAGNSEGSENGIINGAGDENISTKKQNLQNAAYNNNDIVEKICQDNFFNERLFFLGLNKAKKTNEAGFAQDVNRKRSDSKEKNLKSAGGNGDQIENDLIELNNFAIGKEKIIGGIVPHHLLAVEAIAEFFSKIAEKEKNSDQLTIVLFSPNHYESGKKNIQVIDCDWQTYGGKLFFDRQIFGNQSGDSKDVFEYAKTEDAQKEHGIADHLAFVKYFSPNAKVLPIIFKKNTSKSELEMLVENLLESKKDGQRMIFVSSVDFSHETEKKLAFKNDEESWRAIKNFDFEKVYSFGNEHFDSPASLSVLLILAQKLGAEAEPRIFFHRHSTEILGESSFGKGTSYEGIVFVEK